MAAHRRGCPGDPGCLPAGRSPATAADGAAPLGERGRPPARGSVLGLLGAWEGPEQASPEPPGARRPGGPPQTRPQGRSPGDRPGARREVAAPQGQSQPGPELTVGRMGQLPGSAEAEGPRKPLGHALLAGQYRPNTDSEGQGGVLSHRETGTRSEPPPRPPLFHPGQLALSSPSPHIPPAASSCLLLELPVLEKN